MTLIHFEEQDPKKLIKSQRAEILNHFKHTCVYCKSKTKHMTIDHVIPIKYGGSERTSNKVTACRSCNLDKAHEPWIPWYRRQSFYDAVTEVFIKEWIDVELREAS
ncbi:MAG: HNH endonuclease [Nodosilinea sp. WJT8-NPBG4]|jgi:5-methylcytosine-specific restriction endonuclease McrA|nr:HNH endonuclease [Nodosilinea sp. WJT8-NPBG4]